MEEADLLKERLQAITDKRRIQENIAMKRRQIEEEKLKLQYIKKKALREQWLMDGLSQQSEEEQEAMKLQAQDEQQQSDQLQSNILRIEKEIEALEMQELHISANEEAVLKRLKEVERTAEDIIKELNAEFHADLTHHVTSPPQDIPSFISLAPAKNPPMCGASEEPKKATFAMEISVEHDKRTGKSQVVSTATITPETIQDRGWKVYDDGRKSVYALHPSGDNILNGVVGEMTPTEVEELLKQATDRKVPTEVQYHQPVYSVPYTGSSRPSTPRTPNKTQRLTPTSSPSPFQSAISSRNAAENHNEEHMRSQDPEECVTLNKTPSPTLIQDDLRPKVHRPEEETKMPFSHIPGQSDSDRQLNSQSHFGSNKKMDVSSPNPAALVSIKARNEGMPEPIQPVYKAVDSSSPSLASHRSEADPDSLVESMSRYSPFHAESVASLNLINTLPELELEPVTMIFMGYEKAEDEEEENIQAELVIISNSDDDDGDDDEAQFAKNESDGEESLSYHPEGYKSKVFQPKVGIAKVTGCRDIIEDTFTDWEDLRLHKPTFIHKPGTHSPYLQGEGEDESANTDSINMEKMKLCSTGR